MSVEGGRYDGMGLGKGKERVVEEHTISLRVAFVADTCLGGRAETAAGELAVTLAVTLASRESSRTGDRKGVRRCEHPYRVHRLPFVRRMQLVNEAELKQAIEHLGCCHRCHDDGISCKGKWHQSHLIYWLCVQCEYCFMALCPV